MARVQDPGPNYPAQANKRLDPDFLYAYPFDGSVCGFL